MPGEDLIRVFDAYGRELHIPREEWRTKMLPGAVERARDNPAQLYGVIAQALQDGFAADVLEAAEHLARTDAIPARGALALGAVCLTLGRLDDAERALERFPEEALVVANLSRVFAERGDAARAEATLWRALQLDPNQESALAWYAQAHPGDGIARAAELPGSWRAQVWLAREALQRGDLAAALDLYKLSLHRMPRPAPADALMQISGDLGKAGRLQELVELTAPLFEAAVHGLWVGNNLIKANLDLGRLAEAQRIVRELHALQRPDWREHLQFWDAEIAKAQLPREAPDGAPQVKLMAIEGPVWTRDGSPFIAVLPPKPADAHRVVFFGSTALMPDQPDRLVVQLSDGPGRMSRALPLLLAEQLHLGSASHATALIPIVQGRGFALFGAPYEDKDLCEMAKMSRPHEVVSLLVDAREEPWTLSFRRLRAADAALLDSGAVRADARDPWPGVRELLARVQQVAPPEWYGVPDSDYLLRLEQSLAVMTEHFVRGFAVNGEHEMLDGALQLCLRAPRNELVRMLFAQTLREMKKIRPEMVAEYRERIERLQREHPAGGELVERVLAGLF